MDETSNDEPASKPRDPQVATVYFDGACALCTREVRWYRSLAGADQIEWVDANELGDARGAGELTREDALARFHVRRTDGSLTSGASAFTALWATLPRLAPLGRIASSRGATRVLEPLYRRFLVARPWLQRGATWLEAGDERRAWRRLQRDLRSDHAGEVGAVAIYDGMLNVLPDGSDVHEFARRHRATEQRHVEVITALLSDRPSRLLSLWRASGWLLGSVSARLGARPAYLTVEAVERFVEHHYRRQIDWLAEYPQWDASREALARCRNDEMIHRDEASGLAADIAPWRHRAWSAVVAAGSACAVAVARRV